MPQRTPLLDCLPHRCLRFPARLQVGDPPALIIGNALSDVIGFMDFIGGLQTPLLCCLPGHATGEECLPASRPTRQPPPPLPLPRPQSTWPPA